MKTVTIRDLNRRTAAVLDAVEQGETFELRRNGKVVAYLTSTPPHPETEPDWSSHFQWLRKQPRRRGARLLLEFEEERRRLRKREKTMSREG